MASRVIQRQSDVAAVRRGEISQQLADLLESVGSEADVYFEVTSGGQPTKKEGGARTGSSRHDHGNSADTKAYTLNSDGSKHYLDMSVPADRKVWERIVQLSVASGATGIGAGTDYMGNKTMHIGYGKSGTWGAGGHSANAPDWLVSAYDVGTKTPPLNIGSTRTAAAPIPAPLTRSLDIARTKFAGLPPPPTVAAPFPATMSAALAATRKGAGAPRVKVASVEPPAFELDTRPRGTIAGGVVGKAIGSAVDEGTRRIAVAAPAIASGAQKMASDAASGIGGFFGDLFGGKPAAAPPKLPAPMAPTKAPVTGLRLPTVQAPAPAIPAGMPVHYGSRDSVANAAAGRAALNAPQALPTLPALPPMQAPIPHTMPPGLRLVPPNVGMPPTLPGMVPGAVAVPRAQPDFGGGLIGALNGFLNDTNRRIAFNTAVAQQAKRDPGGFAIGQANRASPNPSHDVSGGNNAFNPASVQNSTRWQTGY